MCSIPENKDSISISRWCHVCLDCGFETQVWEKRAKWSMPVCDWFHESLGNITLSCKYNWFPLLFSFLFLSLTLSNRSVSQLHYVRCVLSTVRVELVLVCKYKEEKNRLVQNLWRSPFASCGSNPCSDALDLFKSVFAPCWLCASTY